MDLLNQWLSSNGLMPHGFCYQWKPALVWLHVISDTLIALAYFSIPITLIHLVRKRRDIPFSWMFVCFGVFIAASGATHVMEVWTLWIPSYWVSGGIKVITALASIPTAVSLVRLVPKAWSVTALVGTAEDISDRKRAEEELRRLSGQLLRLQDEERRSIARDLHDSTGQNLVALATTLSQLHAAIPSADRKLRKLAMQCQGLADQCVRLSLAFIPSPSSFTMRSATISYRHQARRNTCSSETR